MNKFYVSDITSQIFNVYASNFLSWNFDLIEWAVLKYQQFEFQYTFFEPRNWKDSLLCFQYLLTSISMIFKLAQFKYKLKQKYLFPMNSMWFHNNLQVWTFKFIEFSSVWL